MKAIKCNMTSSCLPFAFWKSLFVPSIVLPEDDICTFCKEQMHTLETCPVILQHITYQCSLIEDETLLRQYLALLDSTVLQNYVNSHDLKQKMYMNCSKYYDRYIAPFASKPEEFNIELMVGYMHVLPLYPEISVKRKKLLSMQTMAVTM